MHITKNDTFTLKTKSNLLFWTKKTRPSILPTSSKLSYHSKIRKQTLDRPYVELKLGVIIIEVKNIIVAAER
jgi:hypothetical protein